MSNPEHFVRFWRSVDALFDRMQPTPWGAVVTDRRYPAIWDANYARVDVPTTAVSVEEVASALVPALSDVDAETFHVVCFDPDDSSGLLPRLAGLGHGRSWDIVMELSEPASVAAEADVEELDPGQDLWDRMQESLSLFGVDGTEAVQQLARMERELLAPAGKRWFGIRQRRTIVAMGALMTSEGVGYVDNVVTFPRARGRGYASAITASIAREAKVSGAEHVMLLADPDERTVVRMYERLGFREVGRLASTKGPTPVTESGSER